MSYTFKKKRYRLLMPVFDILGAVIFFPLRIFKKNLPKNPKRILVVRLDHIGDFVCTTPVFKNLKERFPEAKITVLINSVSKDLAFRNPYIDKVISFSPFYLARNKSSSQVDGLRRVVKDVKALGFDLGIDPRGDLMSILLMWLGRVKYRVGYGITGGSFLLNRACGYDNSRHIIDRNLALLEALNIPISHRLAEVYFNEKDEGEVERLLRPRCFALFCDSKTKQRGLAMTERDGTRNDTSAVVIHPFAGAKAKEWPRENFQKLIDMMKEKGCDVVLVGSKDDRGSFTNVIDMRGRLNLPQLACLIKKIGFFIGLDSGPANIAAALNVPSVIICSGTNVPELWVPKGDNVRFVYKEVECKPCGLKICPKEKHECMDPITAEEVFDKFKEIASAAKAASQ